ncbi:ester hydrolase C11orf54 homolog isoform X2 [Chelonoidis abingdonii]|uniref:ester hydrolase C11orf54 homolog isoform X2 n=1 Tax=Chelonoidis abingdonii TaxID=106734 RepID=UPI0013F2A816|nr:ester hydrolase C11orf54 homolog isoform X3 [Chelonoidis abingdonii]
MQKLSLFWYLCGCFFKSCPREAIEGCWRELPRVHGMVYDLNTVAKQIELPGAFILGAGAGSSRILGVNAELIPVAQAESEQKPAVNASYTAQINPADGGCLLEKYSDKYSDCEFGLLANLYASQGQPGKVIEVKANGRTGRHNFVTCIRQIIEKCYGDKPVGIGGTFVIQKGKAKIHIMPPEFSACPLNTDEEMNNWLHFFEMKAPLICQPVLISRDPCPENSRTRACCAKRYLFVQRLSLSQRAHNLRVTQDAKERRNRQKDGECISQWGPGDEGSWVVWGLICEWSTLIVSVTMVKEDTTIMTLHQIVCSIWDIFCLQKFSFVLIDPRSLIGLGEIKPMDANLVWSVRIAINF